MQTTLPSQETGFLKALTILGQASKAVSQVASGDANQLRQTLSMIADAANQLARGAWATIVPIDPEKEILNFQNRVSAGQEAATFPEAFVNQALNEQAPVLSYNRPPGIHLPDEPAMACYPLKAENGLVGALVVATRSQTPFSQVEKICMENLAAMAAIAIHQTGSLSDIQRDLDRKEEELKQLRQAGLLISSRLQLEETLNAILEMALAVTNAHYGIFRLVDKTGQRLITRAVAGEALNRPLVDVLPISANSVMGWVARNRQPACIADLREEPWRSIYFPLDPAIEMRSELAVPIIGASGRLEGVLNLESPQVNGFSEQDRHLMQSFATQAVIAIQEVRLLDALQEVAQLLLSQPSQKVLVRLVGLACDLLNADSSAIWILKEGQLALQATFGSLRPKEHLESENSLAGQVIYTRAAKAVQESKKWAFTDLEGSNDWINALAVPMLAGTSRQPTGVMAVFSPKNDASHFAESEWDKKVLTCLAYYAALAVQHASHQEELRTAQEQRAVAETFAAIGDIAANVLHHLNNKVGTIPVRIQGIRDKCEPVLSREPYLSANLSEIERSANEAMESVRENLSHLRPITLADVNVARCVASAIENAKLAPGIRVNVSGLSSLPPVVAAHRSLALVFTNLLDNAQDAMAGEGTISITGVDGGDWVEIILEDSGSGIAPELHDRIFELSYSGRGPGRNSKLGFGLWWVKTLMARLGGSVVVESDGEHGATFRVRLPAVGRKR
ncbi:MAG TPA: GAF domain-containing protein [Anaerolineaceae bacterium]|nr:GAF domain-containing protein [Anaerolineaceae bacterium]